MASFSHTMRELQRAVCVCVCVCVNACVCMRVCVCVRVRVCVILFRNDRGWGLVKPRDEFQLCVAVCAVSDTGIVLDAVLIRVFRQPGPFMVVLPMQCPAVLAVFIAPPPSRVSKTHI